MYNPLNPVVDPLEIASDPGIDPKTIGLTATPGPFCGELSSPAPFGLQHWITTWPPVLFIEGWLPEFTGESGPQYEVFRRFIPYTKRVLPRRIHPFIEFLSQSGIEDKI
jgi:hypothetical protein